MDYVAESDLQRQLKTLTAKVNELIELCQQLQAENSALRAQERALYLERAKLLEKNELARSRVEAMISRLKALESS